MPRVNELVLRAPLKRFQLRLEHGMRRLAGRFVERFRGKRGNFLEDLILHRLEHRAYLVDSWITVRTRDGRRVPAGVYFIRGEGDVSFVRRAVRLR